MKRCSSCGGFALYEVILELCPVCNNTLVPIDAPASASTATRAGAQRNATSSSNIPPVHTITQSTPDMENEVIFETVRGRTHRIRGRITEISPITRYQTRMQKFLQAAFRGEPYQFGHQVLSVRIRIEEHTNGYFAENVRDVMLFGDYEGRLQIGSDVSVRAKRKRDRLIAKRVYLHDTNMHIRPGIQLPSFLFATLAFMVVILLTLLIRSIANGSLIAAITAMFTTLASALLDLAYRFMPYILIIGIVVYYIRRRRWRRG